MRVLALAWLGMTVACGGTGVFACTDASECGVSGTCEPNGYCSFPDAACASGSRYGAHAPSGIADVCVEPLGEKRSRLRLEGRISGADVGLLDGTLGELAGHALSLDLTQLRFIDARGVARLAELLRAGAVVERSSPFVDQLLARSERDSPRPPPSAKHGAGARRA